MTKILKPGRSGSRRPPVALASGSVTRQSLAPVEPPNGPRWQPQHQCDPRSDLWLRIALPPRGTFRQTFSAPSPTPGWLNSKWPDAHPALPEVTRRPPPSG
jgi:hypothetical protein